MNNKNNLNVFIISSFVSLITLFYVGLYYTNKQSPIDISFHLFPIIIPILYGIFGLINKYVISKYGINYSILVGSVFGILLSSLGRFILNLPTKIFNFTNKNSYKVHIYAIIMYSFIFRFIITPLTNYLV